MLAARRSKLKVNFMQFSAAQIAALINGRLDGDAQATVASFGKIEEAQQGQLAFLANPKYEDHLYTTKASVIIINEALELRQPLTATLIRVPDAYSAFATLLSTYQKNDAATNEWDRTTLLYFQICIVWTTCFYRGICLPR